MIGTNPTLTLPEQAHRLARCTVGGYLAPDAGPEPREIFLESRDHLDVIAGPGGLCGATSVVFAPVDPHGASAPATQATVVDYGGTLRHPGDELVLADEFYLQTQDYLGAGWLAVPSPTVVRIETAEDLEAFLTDADAALQGRFPAHLTHPALQLADVCCLGGAPPCAGLARLHVSATGDLRTAAHGAALGIVGDGADQLVERMRALDDGPCATPGPLGERRRSAAADRPWLPRYLAALEALKRLATTGRRDLRVSGFGERLVPGLEAFPHEAPCAPLLLSDGQGCVLFEPAGRVAFSLGTQAAQLAELASVTGSLAAAAEHAETLLAIDPGAARRALDQLVSRLAERGLSLGIAEELPG